MAAEKKKKISLGAFLTQVRQEMKKVTWPKRNEVTVTTVMVVFIAIIAALFFLAVDAVVYKLIEFILGS